MDLKPKKPWGSVPPWEGALYGGDIGLVCGGYSQRWSLGGSSDYYAVVIVSVSK